MFTFYLQTTFCTSGSNGSLGIALKPKFKKNIYAQLLIFYFIFYKSVSLTKYTYFTNVLHFTSEPGRQTH